MAKTIWEDLAVTQSDEWKEHVPTLVFSAAKTGQAKLVLQFITETKSEETFFPLYRALSYLSTFDELLIEKLSPEIRKLVLDMVEEFRSQFADVPPTKPKKAKSTSRQPINKRLT